MGGGYGQFYDGSYAAFVTFTNLTGQPTSALVTSNIFEVDLGGSQSISISGDGSPQYRICADEACAVENHMEFWHRFD